MFAKRSALLSLVVAAMIAATASALRAEQTPWMHVADEYSGENWGIFDLENLWDSGAWQDRHSFTGNWGTLRPELARAGIAVLGSYDTETDGNPVGGDLRKVRLCDTLGIAGFMDLERLFHLKNTFFLVSMATRMGHSLSADIPNFFTVQQLYGGETIRLDHLALETSFMDDRLDIVGGRLNALDDFAASSYFCLPMASSLPIRTPSISASSLESSCGWCIMATRALAPASSMRSIALSGRNLPVM